MIGYRFELAAGSRFELYVTFNAYTNIGHYYYYGFGKEGDLIYIGPKTEVYRLSSNLNHEAELFCLLCF